MSWKVVPRDSRLTHSGDKNHKKHAQRNFKKKTQKTSAEKNRNLLKLAYFLLVFGPPFFSFFGPGTHLATKAPKSEKHVTKRWAKGDQNEAKNLKATPGFFQISWKVVPRGSHKYIPCFQLFRTRHTLVWVSLGLGSPCFKVWRNPARRNARSALNNQ